MPSSAILLVTPSDTTGACHISRDDSYLFLPVGTLTLQGSNLPEVCLPHGEPG